LKDNFPKLWEWTAGTLFWLIDLIQIIRFVLIWFIYWFWLSLYII
jgi:hypothetical protein